MKAAERRRMELEFLPSQPRETISRTVTNIGTVEQGMYSLPVTYCFEDW